MLKVSREGSGLATVVQINLMTNAHQKGHQKGQSSTGMNEQHKFQVY